MKSNSALTTARAGLIIAVIGLLTGVGFIIASFSVGLDTSAGSRYSTTGTILVVAFIVLVIALSAVVSKLRGRTAEGVAEPQDS